MGGEGVKKFRPSKITAYFPPHQHHTIYERPLRRHHKDIKRACKIILGRHYISYSNAIDVCNLQTLSARRQAHCLSFANSLSKSERTSKLLPRTRKDVSGRRLRNSDDLTQLPAHTQRFARSPVPY